MEDNKALQRLVDYCAQCVEEEEKEEDRRVKEEDGN